MFLFFPKEMNLPPTYQEAVTESQHFPSVATVHNRVRSPDVTLWEGEVRRKMGVLQIILGVTEFSLGILVILAPSDYLDFFGWGIWNGVVFI